MRSLLFISFVFFSSNVLSFKVAENDSLWNEASKLPRNQGIEFLLDNFYPVFTKSMEDGVEWLEQTLEFSKQVGNVEYEGRANLGLGTVWYLHGDYEKAIVHFQEALGIFEESNNTKYIGRTCNELSVYTRKQKQYEKALEYLDRSYEECMNAKDYECVETSLNNRGVIYEMMGKYDLAVEYYNKARDIAIEYDNQIGLSYIYNNLAEVYRLREMYDSSAYFIDQSSEIRQRIGDVQGIAINWINKGELYLNSGDYNQAIECFDTTIRMAREVGYMDLLKRAHEFGSKAYQFKGDTEKSFYHLERSFFLKDSLLNTEKLKSLSEMEVKFDTERKEKERLVERDRRTQAELAVTKRDKWIYAIAGSLVAFVFLSLFVLQYRSRKAQAEKDAAVLEEKEKGLEAVFDATEEERQRIAKDLHDGVGQQMSGLKMAWSNLSVDIKSKLGDESEKLEELTKILDETAGEVRSISHQMMPKVLEEYGLIEGISEMLDKSLKLSTIKYQFEHFNFEGRLETRIEISLYRVCQELINNVIKHSGATQVNVQLFKNKDNLILIVEDNGKGLDENNDSDGHGLLNIKSRLNTIHGKVNYEASPTAGTTATIRINLNA